MTGICRGVAPCRTEWNELFLAVADKACKIEEMSATPMGFFVFLIIELVASFRVVSGPGMSVV